MKLFTANRLTDGFVLWYADGQWVEDAALATQLDDEAAETLKAEWLTRETEVVAPYIIPVTDEGTPVQREWVREYVRANGPTIGQTTFDTARQFNRSEVF